MHHSFENELVALFNSVRSPKQLVERFRIPGVIKIDLQLAERIMRERDSLPRRRFRSIGQIAAILGLDRERLKRLLDVIRSWPWNDHPVLLLPIRIETRFLGNDLWVRVYPDQALVDTHDPRLTQEEFNALKSHFDQLIDSQVNAFDATGPDVWRGLVQLFGPERAAWIVKTVADGLPEEDQLRPEEEGWITVPKLPTLPDHFVVFAYLDDGTVRQAAGKPIPADLTMLAAQTQNQEEFFDEKSRWMVDHLDAKNNGMAVCINNVTQKISRLVVVGLKETSAQDGQVLLEKLIDSHHYSTGLGFLKHGTPTNNTQRAQSGHSETAEDRESSYETEILGPPRWTESNGVIRTNAERLGQALGLGKKPEALRHIAGAGDTADSFAKEMQTALWPATGDYFLHYLLPGIVDDDGRQKLAQHFIDYVRGSGPLPAIRIGDQPYGILPVTSFRSKEENARGWAASSLDNQGNDDWLTFDERLHAILFKLYDKKWLPWANDHGRVPRVRRPDNSGNESDFDHDLDLLQILSMEPLSVSYQARPFVDERFVAWLLIALKDYVFGPNTPYSMENRSPLFWVQRWAEVWEALQTAQASHWSNITGIPSNLLKSAPLLHLLAWWNDRDLELDLVRPDSGEGQVIQEYLRNLCNPEEDGEQAHNTLLYSLLRLSLDLAPENGGLEPVSPLSKTSVRDAICRLANSSLLEFFNSATMAEGIVRRIKDDPGFQSDSDRAYGVRLGLAQRILDVRNSLPNGRFTSIGQIDEIYGVGVDTLHDIIHSFPDDQLTTDIDRLFRETLDLFTHRLDAWITSLATKRLVAMRETQPTGIYLGAYGWVENLSPEGELQSARYIHAPSRGQSAAAAVLHNAYLTYMNDNGVNPFRINLNSERVRRALRIIEGVRQGQPLGAMLGYLFERRLHERGLDQYIDDFRAAFPIVANKETGPDPGASVEAIAARNVVDGLALVRWRGDPDRTDIVQGDPSAIAVMKEIWNGSEQEDQQSEIPNSDHESLRREIDHLRSALDAISDVLMYEGVYQSVQGNFERGSAAIDASAGNAYLPEIESVLTPVQGNSFGQRVCILFPPIAAPNQEDQQDAPAPLPNPHPRIMAEPRIADWIGHILGDDMSQIGCRFHFKSRRININEATAPQFKRLPGIELPIADRIISYRDGNGPFADVDDLKRVSGIGQSIVDGLRPLVTTGSDGFESDPERLNINEATEPQLDGLPGIGPVIAHRIVLDRDGNGPFSTVEDLKDVPGVDQSIIDEIRRWVMTGAESLEEERYYERIDVNEATEEELASLPPINQKMAKDIVSGRPFVRLDDLRDVGVDTTTINHIRPWVTTGLVLVSLADLNIKPVDVLYMSPSPPQGEETEIEQRIAYWVRTEFAMQYDERVEIQFDRTSHFTYSIGEALEMCRQILNMLGMGNPLRPGLLSLPAEADISGFAKADKDELLLRVCNLLQNLNKLITELDSDPISIDGLFRASLYGVSGAIPSAPNDPKLKTRKEIVLDELNKRMSAALQLLQPEDCEEIIAGNQDGVNNGSDQLVPDREIQQLVEAMQTLLGRSFVVLPTFVPHQVEKLAAAFEKPDLLAGQGEERVRFWLQQAAQVHPALRELEDTMMMTEAWCQATLPALEPALTLQVAQLPADSDDHWLALDDDERKTTNDADEDISNEEDIGIESSRGVLSIVAAIGGNQPFELLHEDEELIVPVPVAGLLLDQWNELIPERTVDTSVAFQYDAPNNQAPQAMLLAVPSQRDPTLRLWKEKDLAEIVRDTIDLAKIRAVDLDAMREIEGDASADSNGVGPMFPALMFPTDPTQPGWAREAFKDSIQEWINTLARWEQKKVTGTIRNVGTVITPQVTLWTEQQESWTLQGPLISELRRLGSAQVEVQGKADSESSILLAESYEILDVGGGQRPVVGLLSETNGVFVVTDEDGVLWTLEVPQRTAERLTGWVGGKIWVVGAISGQEIDVTTYGFLRAPEQ